MVSDIDIKRYRIAARRFWRVSPLTLRIMAVNMAAVIVLGMGVLYTGQYERELIDSELQALANEGRLFAAALAEGGVREDFTERATLVDDLSRHMLRKLLEDRDIRTLLFDRGGEMIADSHQLLGAGGLIQMQELPPLKARRGWVEGFEEWGENFLKFLPTHIPLPEYPETLSGRVQSYPHAIDTLAGNIYTNAWRGKDGNILLTVSLPVQRLKTVLGAVLIAKTGDDIERAVRSVQLTVLKIFLFSLTLTVLLSVYLSTTIGRPIMRLARAVENIREGIGSGVNIPDLSARRDEIGVLSVALRDMTKALSDRMSAIENFAADVAHEIKNPLASVRSAIEAFEKVTDPARQAQLAAIIHDDIRRIDRLISDISAASRLDAEISRAEKEVFDLRGLLATLADTWKAKMAGGSKIALSMAGDKKLLVSGHQGQLAHVFYNLLDNAVSFTPTGRDIKVNAFSKDGKIAVFVENEGPPIPDGNLERIFERFYTERPAAEDFGRHSGLGLSISRQILRAHQGDVIASNIKNDDGTHRAVRFTVTLPEIA